jgi:hypothetical protein
LTAQTFAALKDLIAVAHLWDSTVHEAINLLELDESMYVPAVLSFAPKLTAFYQCSLLAAVFTSSCGPPLRSSRHTDPV